MWGLARLWLLSALLVTVGAVTAAPSTAKREGPVTLRVLNRDVITMRVPLMGASPAVRVQRAEQVHALLISAAEETQGVRTEPKPYVSQRALSDFYVEYEVFVHIDRAADRIPMLSALHANIQDEFNEHGVQIMSLHFLAQPDQRVLVPKSHWFRAPAQAGRDAA